MTDDIDDEEASTVQLNGTGRTRMLRQRLKARREALRLTQEQVADRISADEIRNAHHPSEAKPIGGTAVSNWETMYRNPKIHDFAAWARALGMRLIVDLDDQDSDRVAVLLPRGRALELAKAIGTLNATDLDLVESFVRRLIKD
jgi:transcriptional regulator with XRE-family HTH domain